MILSLLAFNLGFKELNPIMLVFLTQPIMLILIKFVLPLIIAWALPGKWLWPGNHSDVHGRAVGYQRIGLFIPLTLLS